MPKIIPFKDTLLVKRRPVSSTLTDGKTKGGIFLPDKVESSFTDIADVVQVPEFTFSDKKIIDNAEKMIDGLTKKVIAGDDNALQALLDLNDFIVRKSIKVGDAVFLSKYAGTDFTSTDSNELQTLIKCSDINGLVVSDE